MHTELKNKSLFFLEITHAYSVAIQLRVNGILISKVLYSHDNGAWHNAEIPGAHYHEPGLLHQKGQQEGGRDKQLPVIFKGFYQSHMY